MIFREWHDFVTYPLDPERVHTRVARLDIAAAYRRGQNGQYPEEYSGSLDRGAIIDQAFLVKDGDIFECMEIDDFGHVTIWTSQKIWFLVRDGSSGGIEKLRYVPRHPPTRS